MNMKLTLRSLFYFSLFATAAAVMPTLGLSQALSNSAGGIYGTANDPGLTLGHAGQDTNFLQRGLEDGNAAIIFSKLALTKTSNPDVKALAQKALDKHMAIGGGLVVDARGLKTAIPKGLNSRYSQTYQDLSKLSGDEFDKAYVAALLKLQHDDYENMQDESKGSGVVHLQEESQKDMGTLAQLDGEAEKLSKKLNGK